MDWFSWLSKTGLEPALIYEYGLSFTHNELEECDIAYFNHEFLQSMGISIAKHRLEILKLARKEKKVIRPRPMTRLLVAVKKTKKCLAGYIQRWIHRDDRAIVVVPKPSCSSRWKSAMVKRNKKVQAAPKPGQLLLTNGSPLMLSGTNGTPLMLPAPRGDSFPSPAVSDVRKEERMDGKDDGYWSSGFEQIRWDTMFQDLKPT